MRVHILGCGTSAGVPSVAHGWGTVDPANPKNRRRRVSIMIEEGDSRVLIDTGPDLREQLLAAAITHVDAVFWTHDHADHTHGLDDLRGLFHTMGRQVPCYGSAATLDILTGRFGYVFDGAGGYPAVAEARVIEGPVQCGALTVLPFEQIHGRIRTLGFRVGGLAYSTDLNEIPAESEAYLRDLDLWIVDALRHTPHPTHPHLAKTLKWIDHFQPQRALLTHMDWSMDFDALSAALPPHIRPAYDGQVIAL